MTGGAVELEQEHPEEEYQRFSNISYSMFRILPKIAHVRSTGFGVEVYEDWAEHLAPSFSVSKLRAEVDSSIMSTVKHLDTSHRNPVRLSMMFLEDDEQHMTAKATTDLPTGTQGQCAK